MSIERIKKAKFLMVDRFDQSKPIAKARMCTKDGDRPWITQGRVTLEDAACSEASRLAYLDRVNCCETPCRIKIEACNTEDHSESVVFNIDLNFVASIRKTRTTKKKHEKSTQ